MLNLVKGIQLFYHNVDINPDRPRIWLSSGTVPATESILDGIRYRHDAFIPAEPWRKPTQVEHDLLWMNEIPSNLSASVGIVRFPDEVLAPFVDLGLDTLTTTEDFQALVKHPDRKQAVRWVSDYLTSYCLADQTLVAGLPNYKLIAGNLGGNPPGLNTVTFDKSQGAFVGLHVDSWDRLSADRQDWARNRITINLGREDRYFLFINLTLKEILSILNNADLDRVQRNDWQRDLRAEFMKQHPTYPAIKVRISPGEAYIAPTENMIHDGCTVGKKYFDSILTFRGHFGVPTAEANYKSPQSEKETILKGKQYVV